jgi:hypothetical protein
MNTVTVGNESLMTMLTRPDWTHAITVTKRNCESIGDIYTHMLDGLNRLQRVDKVAKFVLVACQHISYGGMSAPHGHGVLRTRLSHREINKCFSGGFTELSNMRCPFGWAEYIQPQAIPECHLTNIEE